MMVHIMKSTSNEMAFSVAASMALKAAAKNANPVIIRTNDES